VTSTPVPYSNVEALILDVAVFEDRTFGEVTKIE
jgi:hypothetical protein